MFYLQRSQLLFFFDRNRSHLTYGTVKLAIENEIIIICLPPHTSHALQPLDVGVFKGLKADWRRILIYVNVGGFRGAGLWPFNSDAVSLEKCQSVLEDSNTPDDIGSPQRILREAIVSAIASTSSAETVKALENSKKKRKRV